jgi:hypothetical protein
MGALHEELLVSLRRKVERDGFRLVRKSPMPAYRADLFAQRLSKKGQVLEEVVAEAEIESSLFFDHTLNQLEHISEYIRFQKRKRIKVTGYLVVPKKKSALLQATQLLETLDSDSIKLVSF